MCTRENRGGRNCWKVHCMLLLLPHLSCCRGPAHELQNSTSCIPDACTQEAPKRPVTQAWGHRHGWLPAAVRPCLCASPLRGQAATRFGSGKHGPIKAKLCEGCGIHQRRQLPLNGRSVSGYTFACRAHTWIGQSSDINAIRTRLRSETFSNLHGASLAIACSISC